MQNAHKHVYKQPYNAIINVFGRDFLHILVAGQGGDYHTHPVYPAQHFRCSCSTRVILHIGHLLVKHYLDEVYSRHIELSCFNISARSTKNS